MFSSSEQMVVKGLLMAGVKMNLRQVEQDFSSFFAKSLAYVFDDFSKFHSTFRYQICHNTRASHNATSNSADLSIVLMTKSSWKFLHNTEHWIIADKKNLHSAEILE